LKEIGRIGSKFKVIGQSLRSQEEECFFIGYRCSLRVT